MCLLPPRTFAPLLLLGSLCASASAAVQEPVDATPARRPNVVLVLADDLGWNELGCQGSSKLRTPNVDRLAAEGLRFTRHYSGSPVCAPSRCVLLTGLHTGHAQVRDNWENGGWARGAPEGQWPLAEGTATLARLLRDAGYATACVGKWGLGGPGTSGAPENQGFDHFFGHLCQRIAHNHYPDHLWRDGERVEYPDNPWFASHQKLTEPLPEEADYGRYLAGTYAPDALLADALGWVRAHAGGPFFLYYASPLTHAGLQVPAQDLEAWPREWDTAPYLGQQGYVPHPRPRAAYAAMVAHLDREVGALLDLLEELELVDDTIVLFTSDNGPTFNGGTDSPFFDSAGGLRGLKCSVHEGGLRVPLVVRWPGHVAAGGVSEHVSAFEDHLPTLLELCGVAVPEGLDGISMAPTLLGRGEQPRHRELYFEYAGQQALLADGWKAVRKGLRRGDLTLELYHLDEDPAETTDVADAHPLRAAEMARRMQAARTPSTAFPQPALDDPPHDEDR